MRYVMIILVVLSVFGMSGCFKSKNNGQSATDSVDVHVLEKKVKQYGPIDFVDVGFGFPECGVGGKTPFVKNFHVNKKIKVKMVSRQQTRGKRIEKEIGTWVIEPGEKVVLEPFCTIPGPTKKVVAYFARSAEWVDESADVEKTAE